MANVGIKESSGSATVPCVLNVLQAFQDVEALKCRCPSAEKKVCLTVSNRKNYVQKLNLEFLHSTLHVCIVSNPHSFYSQWKKWGTLQTYSAGTTLDATVNKNLELVADITHLHCRCLPLLRLIEPWVVYFEFDEEIRLRGEFLIFNIVKRDKKAHILVVTCLPLLAA